MTSSCLTFDLRYVLDIQRIQSLGTGHPHVQISGLLYEVHRILFSIAGISNKCHTNVQVQTA